MDSTYKKPSREQLAEAIYNSGRAAFSAGDMQAALHCYREVLESGSFIGTQPAFLHDLLRLGDPGVQELVRARNVEEAKMEAGSPHSTEITRWQKFNDALGTNSDALQVYKRNAGPAPHKTVVRFIALWTVVMEHNRARNYSAVLPFIEEFTADLQAMGKSATRQKELRAAGLHGWLLVTPTRDYLETSLALEDHALTRRLIESTLGAGAPAIAYFDLEAFAKQHPNIALMITQAVGKLDKHDQLHIAIATCFAELDPEQLIAGGAPRDEYEGEAAKLLPKLHRGIAEHELVLEMQEIWRDSFGTVIHVSRDGTQSKPQLTPGYQPPDLRGAVKCIQAAIARLL